MTDTAQSKLDELVKGHNKIMDEATQAIKDLVKKNFTDVSKYFFDAAPEIKAVAFTAYTPGFNDGDPCTYTIGEIYAFPNEDIDIDTYQDEDSYLDLSAIETLKQLNDPASWYHKYYTDQGTLEAQKASTQEVIDQLGLTPERAIELQAVFGSFSSFIQKNEDQLEALLGDNVFVVITRDEIKTEEYDCGY